MELIEVSRTCQALASLTGPKAKEHVEYVKSRHPLAIFIDPMMGLEVGSGETIYFLTGEAVDGNGVCLNSIATDDPRPSAEAHQRLGFRYCGRDRVQDLLDEINARLAAVSPPLAS